MAYPQHRLMQVHSAGEVAYEINTAQVDSVVFKNGEPVEIPFTEYSLEGTSCQWANLGYDNKVIIINDNEELKNYITCTENGSYPDIDFSTRTLLLISGTSGDVWKINATFFENLEKGYILEVILHVTIAAVVKDWNISILTSKIPNETDITLMVSLEK